MPAIAIVDRVWIAHEIVEGVDEGGKGEGLRKGSDGDRA